MGSSQGKMARVAIFIGALIAAAALFSMEEGWVWRLCSLSFVLVGLATLPKESRPSTPNSGGKRIKQNEQPGSPITPQSPTFQSQPVGPLIDQLFNEALEAKTPDSLIEFVDFCARFRRFAPFNARLIQVQRRSAGAVASSNEWASVKRAVVPDAIPILVLKPFGPVEWVYEVGDTSPAINRERIGDPFAATSGLSDNKIEAALRRIQSNCRSQDDFRIEIIGERMGHGFAGSAAQQGQLPIPLPPEAVTLAHSRVSSELADWIYSANQKVGNSKRTIPLFRVKVNDRMTPSERLVTIAHELGHIFCGHLGGVEGGVKGRAGWIARQHLGYHEKEMEAEAVAWLIAKRALIVGGSAAYLKHHVQLGARMSVDPEVVMRAVGRIENLAGLRYVL